MKTILIMTDFSPNATCAAEAGLLLSGKLRADILLFHTYIDYSMVVAYSGAGWAVEEFTERQRKSQSSLRMLMEGLESLTDQLDPADYKPEISLQTDDSNLGMDLEDILNQNEVEMIVIGARSHPADDILYGADTGAVIKKATCPVLVVPAKTDLRHLRKVTFATDFDPKDCQVINYLVKLCQLFRYQLQIVHVVKPGKNDASPGAKEIAFKAQLSNINYKGLTYHEVSGVDVASRLNRLLTETGSGMLAMLHHQTSFFAGLFKHAVTPKVLANQKTALLVFPSKMVLK
ncbi:MAG: universal stress protein [Mucilaginibacter sp.]